MMIDGGGGNQSMEEARSTNDNGTFDPFFHPRADPEEGEEDFVSNIDLCPKVQLLQG